MLKQVQHDEAISMCRRYTNMTVLYRREDGILACLAPANTVRPEPVEG